MSDAEGLLDQETTPAISPSAARRSIPLTTRLAIEIPKPKDWQAFQRNCVFLFRSELNDPHAQEYGRGGQNQHGIDVLGRRNGEPDHLVGVQCRLIAKPLKQPKILNDARAALAINAGLKELIFATTAPDDTAAADAAIAVERILRDEGHYLRVVVYGWGQLQTLIAVHEVAYNAFHPAAVGTTAPQAAAGEDRDLANRVAVRVIEQMVNAGLALAPLETGLREATAEDPALHARIDIFRDLFKEQAQPLLAESKLLGLLEKEDLADKPWAQYRIETNLGSLAIHLGREVEAAVRFEAAHAVRPDDPNALANLVLARTIQGRFEEAMTVAWGALNGSPRVDHAVAYLLQAAARSHWAGDPETLIPPDLVGTAHADIGLAEFLRRRNAPGWAERSLEIARRHQEAPEFKRIKAIAVLSLAIESDEIGPGSQGRINAGELSQAADDMKAVAEHCLEIGFADQHDLVANVNNAAVLLRLCDRYAECEALLLRAIPRAGDESQLRRLLALTQSELCRDVDALATLAHDTEPENQILRVELRASDGDVPGALAEALAIDEGAITDHLRQIRWRLIGDMALRLGVADQLETAIAGLRSLDPEDITASLLEIRGLRKRVNEDEAQERLLALAGSVSADIDVVSRHLLAEELHNQGLPEEASQLLEGHVDLSRPSRVTLLYLQSLADSRRDDTFRTALAQAAPEVRNNAATQWTVAAHAWNLGDLNASLAAVDAILTQQPDEPGARLLKIEILIRQDRSSEVFAELAKPLEDLEWRRPQGQFRVASLLGHFGYAERASALAYQLFLQHRDTSRAWMTLATLVLDEGRGDEEKPRLWNETTVQPNAAVDLRYDDGVEVFFVVEPDVKLRKLDPDSWEPSHALVRDVTGLAAGARFTGPDGRAGVISQIRHKYVARLHYVMEHHETRFPEVMGFRRITVDFEQPGGLNALINEIKARHDWIKEEEEQYLNGPTPLGVLARRLGMDTIEVAAGLTSNGVRLKVAAGNASERAAAVGAVLANSRKGGVLDLLAFWTCWRLGALDAVKAICGPMRLPQSAMDRLRARREQFNYFADDGVRSAGYADGRIAFREVSAEVIVERRNEVDSAIAWIKANAEVLPIVGIDDLPHPLREQLRIGRSDVFDSLVLAIQTGALLVTDDLPIREFGRVLGGVNGTWLHILFGVALERKEIDTDKYVRWSADLIDAGHDYIGVSGPVLTQAARLDGPGSEYPGRLLKTLSTMIGGRKAEPRSHVVACVTCLRDLWSDSATTPFRKPVTGHLLRQLLRDRTDDYQTILQALLYSVDDILGLKGYVRDWVRGHFIPDPANAPRR